MDLLDLPFFNPLFFYGKRFECACCGAPSDRDGDGVPDATDNCPDAPNMEQDDMDADGLGDDCDGDRDGDGTDNEADNCAEDPNPDQADCDRDMRGDACDVACVCCADEGCVPMCERPLVCHCFDGFGCACAIACDPAAPSCAMGQTCQCVHPPDMGCFCGLSH